MLRYHHSRRATARRHRLRARRPFHGSRPVPMGNRLEVEVTGPEAVGAMNDPRPTWPSGPQLEKAIEVGPADPERPPYPVKGRTLRGTVTDNGRGGGGRSGGGCGARPPFRATLRESGDVRIRLGKPQGQTGEPRDWLPRWSHKCYDRSWPYASWSTSARTGRFPSSNGSTNSIPAAAAKVAAAQVRLSQRHHARSRRGSQVPSR